MNRTLYNSKRHQRKLFFMLAMVLLNVVSTLGQRAYEIAGSVVDSDGLPLIGATVRIDGTSLGGVTDIDGKYRFNASLQSGDYTLVISSVGFVTSKNILTLTERGSVRFDARLEDDILSLSEVVVTGTGGLTEKRQLGNSIATLKGEDIAGSGALDITGSLSGKMAGIQVMQNSGDPAAGISVRLRSASTVNGSSDPLYIIDGIIVNNNSTDVLNLTSVVQNRLSDINPQDIERIEVIKGAAAAAIYGSRASNGVVQIFTKKGVAGEPRVTVSSSINFNSLRKKIDYNQAPLRWVGNETEPTTRYDYQDMVFENSKGTDNYISISGGTERTKYFGSLSYLYNEGIMRNTDYTRTSGRVRVDQRINDWISFSIGTYVSRSHSNDKPNGGYDYGVLQTILFSDNQIDPRPDEDGNYPEMNLFPNILEYIETFDFQQKNNRSLGDFQLNLAPIKGLTLNYIFGYDNSQSIGTRYAPIGTTTEEASDGSARVGIINTTLINSDINAVYDFEITKDLKSTTSVGTTYQLDKNEISIISASGLALGVQITDEATSIDTKDFRSERSIWGSYIQQTIGFKDKVFATGAARIDGSSSFGKNERNQFYPKVSVSYVVSEEQFWKNTFGSWISSFKVRTAWGEAGNLTAIGPFDRLSNYEPVSIDGFTGLLPPTQIGNSELRPERQSEIEWGFDITALKNRVGLEFSYYTQDIEDLLLNRTLAPTTGASSRIENVGTMNNKGYEIMLSATPVQTSDLTWDVTATYSTNENEVNGIEGDELSIGNFGFSKAINGQPLGVFKQGFYARNDDGSLLLTEEGLPQRELGVVDANGFNVPLRDANGQPSGEELQKVIGDPNPDYIASLINQVTYKNWTVRLQFDAVQGFDVLSWDSRMFFRFGGGVQEERELTGVDPKRTGAVKFGIAEAYVEDGSFTKLREASISYRLVNGPIGLNNILFTLSGRNLVSFDNYSKWDPEVNMDAQSNGSRGGIMGLIPIPRTVKMSITARF